MGASLPQESTSFPESAGLPGASQRAGPPGHPGRRPGSGRRRLGALPRRGALRDACADGRSPRRAPARRGRAL